VTYFVMFPVRALAKKVGAVVPPDERRIHTSPLPDLGGLGLFIGFGIALLAAEFMGGFRLAFGSRSEIFGVLIGGAVIFAVGLVDDRIDMSAPAKLSGQILAAMVLYFSGVTMYWFKIPFGTVLALSPSLTPLVTAVWVIGMANAINLIDGLDGLAGGIVAIASGAFCIYTLRLTEQGTVTPDNIGALIAAITCGICIGFLPHNLHPSKIMMGDSGALFLGFMMAVSTSVVGGRTPDVSGETYFFFAPLFIPFFILGVPILDVSFAIIRRTAKRKGVAHADKDHLHHRLLRLGHGQRRAVAILWVWTALLSGIVIYPTFDPHGNEVVPFGVAILGAILYTWFRPGWGREGAKSDTETVPLVKKKVSTPEDFLE
ncbi:MAG: undecaprenyl/decaprenyl-phosphate alpha-N-acetylglucosaminyl 1-phosphate transferase, partial [Acidimicrobiales bacterium]|nr:undecaprenyl/decaprenyl-phosphate alpha-N-acetylglucosaminyl 1-phosphate transferase [Acidimicrobiales bacterium]